MAAIDFPSTLPLPVNSTVGYDETVNTLQINLAKGSPVTTIWSQDNSVTYNVTWRYSEQQLRALLGFYDLILNKGTKWFNMQVQWMVDPSASGGALTRVQECNFYSTRVSVVNNGKRRTISATLLIRNPARS